MTERSNKRKRPDWKNLPAFLDSSASVSATTFGARRLPEIKALWNAQPESSATFEQKLQSNGGKTSSRHLRRRTTSHLPRRRHRYPRGKSESGTNHSNKRPCRRARRKPALLRQQHESSQVEMSNSFSADRVFWLTTHLWHAKRFHMHDNLFGWKVPLVHVNRGARAALRMASEHHTLVQDVTWKMHPILVSSPDLDGLVKSVQRFCPDLLFACPNAILSGNCFGEGMIHDIDMFPMGAIGPVMWWISRKPLGTSLNVDEIPQWCLHLFVHAAIRCAVCEIVSALSSETPLLRTEHSLRGGLACFQLRGRKATKTIHRALEPVAETSSLMFDWGKTMSTIDLHSQLPHLTAISVRVFVNGKDRTESPGKSVRNGSSRDYIDFYKECIQKIDPTKSTFVSPPIGDCRIILVCQCRGDSSLSQNAGNSGWNVFCHASDASNIFNALVNAGEARAIGLVEESLTRMESEPPLPVFPRDYPDTPSGQSYWDGSSSEWQLVRNCLEQGWGRVKIEEAKQQIVDEKPPLPAVSWSHISTLPENASRSGTAAVVVRGEFGRPFGDVLAGCGHLPMQGNARKRRRPRRRVRPPSVSVSLDRLSHEEAEMHEMTCESLLQSLSLPALVRCHIKINGKGSITAGARILARTFDNEEQVGYIDYLLGFTVAGSFSMSRGLAHGIGFVGAARLLHVLSSDSGRMSCVATNGTDGTRHVELQVFVKASARGCIERAATLSLLF